MTLVLGLTLNLTPCVYPLISVTIAYFGSQARPGVRPWPLALAYVAGITLSFAVLGVSASLFGGLVGEPLQHPVVLITLAGVFVALAASSFGAFEIHAPTALLSRFGRSSSGAGGAVLMGLTMGIVAAPVHRTGGPRPARLRRRAARHRSRAYCCSSPWASAWGYRTSRSLRRRVRSHVCLGPASGFAG
jgi:hypothetical protein